MVECKGMERKVGGEEVGKESKDFLLIERVSHQRVLNRQVLPSTLLERPL